MDSTIRSPKPEGLATATCQLSNADSSRVNRQSNAARQKAYRDRQRGGAPIGRWPRPEWLKTTPLEYTLSVVDMRRTTYFMCRWLIEHASPEIVADLNARKIKIAPTYRRLRAEHTGAVIDLAMRKTEALELGPNFNDQTREAARSLRPEDLGAA
jgi:hypothetical protein